VTLYDAVLDAGSSFGICDFGSYALNSMRIEKGFHAWGVDIGTEYTLFDAGLENFVAPGKKATAQWEFVAFEILSDGPDVLASDPVLLNDRVVGYVTSAMRGFRTGKHLALGYVERGTVAMGDVCAVQSFGELRAAKRHACDVYDPDNVRLKG